MTDLLFGWLEPSFMQRAALAILFLAPACAAMGTHVIQARLAFFSDAIAHSAFTGVAIGLVLGWSPTVTLVGFAALVATAVILYRATGKLPSDTIIGVFLSASIAIGLALVSLTGRIGNFTQYLFGDVLAVTRGEVVVSGFLFLGVFVFLALFGNRLALAGLSVTLARSEGIRVRSLELAFGLLLAILVAVTVRFIGALLVTAMLLVPAAAARQVAASAWANFWLAVGLAAFSGLTGLIFSYHWNIATGAAIVLVGIGGFAACALIGRLRKGK
jgi:zinc transport system permease protein